MDYFSTAKPQTGYQQIFAIGEKTPYTGFALLSLDAKGKYSGSTDSAEVALVILSGKCTITVDGKVYENLGQRKDVFAGPSTTVYVPIQSSYSVAESQGLPVSVAVLEATATKKYASFVVKPEEVVLNHRGVLNYQRDVHDILTTNAEGKVDRIVVGETFTVPGHWSSYPSHKHDTQNMPYETKMDEIYHFKVKPTEGFGVQVLYSDDLSLREAHMIKDGDSMALPEGYHPVVAAPGFQVYYLWVMAGPYSRELTPCDDPKLAWIANIAPMLNGR